MILGIDPSLVATGLCLMEFGSDPRLTTIRYDDLTGLARLRCIADAVASYRHGVRLAVIEGLSFGSRGMADQLAGLHWMIRDRLNMESDLLIVAPSQVKKYVCGKGNAEKSMILREVYRRWGIEADDDNQADAAGLAMIGRAWLDPKTCETEAQREVLKALRKSL